MADRGQLLQQIYDALGAGEIDEVRKHVVNHVEIVERLDVPGASAYHGIDEWERGYEVESETVDDFKVELLAVEELGGRCVADVMIRMRGRGSGAEVGERLAHLVDFDGERVSRWRAFSELDEARGIAREESVRELYELFDAGQLEQAIARVHPEIEWVEPEETIGAQTRVGRDEAEQGINDWTSSFGSYDGELVDVEGAGERVLVEYMQRVSAGGSTVAVETPIFHLWEFRDGLPGRMRMYFERDQALEAAKSKPDPSA